jgi:hypothetical protein
MNQPGCCCMACFAGEPHQPLGPRDDARIERALNGDTRPTEIRLRVATLGPPLPEIRHDGTMTCPCSMCKHQRSLIAPKGAGNASPFVTRAAQKKVRDQRKDDHAERRAA